LRLSLELGGHREGADVVLRRLGLGQQVDGRLVLRVRVAVAAHLVAPVRQQAVAEEEALPGDVLDVVAVVVAGVELGDEPELLDVDRSLDLDERPVALGDRLRQRPDRLLLLGRRHPDQRQDVARWPAAGRPSGR
jgi:hypothetical protein